MGPSGVSAGTLEYSEGSTRIAYFEIASGQRLTPWSVSRSRDCRVEAPVTNGRSICELYESLHDRDYGILVSADRRGVTVFSFDPDRFDIELHLALDAPLAGLAAATEGTGNSRLVMPDGGRRFINDVSPGVPTLTLSRAAFLAAIDRPATMDFGDSAMEPIVQRISSRF